MAHLLYKEEQRFTNLAWVWVLTLAVLLIPVLVIATSEKVSDQDILVIIVSTVAGFVPVVVILFFAKLQVRIDEQGIHYKFFPSVMRWKTVSPNNIQSFEVSERKSIIESLEVGFKRSFINNSVTMNITGKKFARIQLRSGLKLKIGSENPEGMERALKKLISTDSK